MYRAMWVRLYSERDRLTVFAAGNFVAKTKAGQGFRTFDPGSEKTPIEAYRSIARGLARD